MKQIRRTSKNDSGQGDYKATMEECDQLRKEYQLLFNRVPCNILIIDRNFKIVRTNESVRINIGDLDGCFCYEGLKGAEKPCTACTAKQTFQDGQMHTGHHMWKTISGKTVHLHVITVPLRKDNGEFDEVMELAVDVTQTMQLEAKLKFAYDYLETIIATSMDGIVAVNEKSKVTVFNPAAQALFGIGPEQIVSREEIATMMPPGFLAEVSEAAENVHLPETEIKTLNGKTIPVRVMGAPLTIDGHKRGLAVSIQDLRELKSLELAKIEAEKLATVGQTVAGLAHGLKNMVYALDGGMYMLTTGLKEGQIGRIQEGMDTLSRNIARISTTVKTFLNFSKERKLNIRWQNPLEITSEVISVYTNKIESKLEMQNIELIGELTTAIEPVPLDYERIYECLSNLVDNAIHACTIDPDQAEHHVWVRNFEEEGAVIFEVKDDGCGMDYKVKKKVFTNFFTTKGLEGTGLGLLTTKKIVQQHGGNLDFSSLPGKGSVFRMRFPRNKLSLQAIEK